MMGWEEALCRATLSELCVSISICCSHQTSGKPAMGTATVDIALPVYTFHCDTWGTFLLLGNKELFHHHRVPGVVRQNLHCWGHLHHRWPAYRTPCNLLPMPYSAKHYGTVENPTTMMVLR